MEQLFNNPGLIHIGEMIFEQLNNNGLESCSNVCLDWKKMLDNPRTWLKICIKQAPKSNEISSKQHSFEASNVLINQWKQLILEAGNEYENQVANLLKKMYSDQSYKRISGDKTSFRSPIYMALLVEDLPLIRYLLLAYTNCFLSNRISETKSFYELTRSSKILNIYHPPCSEVIEYLASSLFLKIFDGNRNWISHSTHHLRTALETNQELSNFLEFMLEYIVANYPDENPHSRYHFLYRFYLNLGYSNRAPSMGLKIMNNVTQSEKFKYGIHSYLLDNE